MGMPANAPDAMTIVILTANRCLPRIGHKNNSLGKTRQKATGNVGNTYV